MINYSLQDLNTIFNCKHYLTRDRFIHYFTVRYGYPERKADQLFSTFYNFPKLISGDINQQGAILDEILPKCIEIVNEIRDLWEKPLNIPSDRKLIKKVLYGDCPGRMQVVLDLYNPVDLVTYAEMIKRGVKIFGLLDLNCEFYHIGVTHQVFEGDLFDTNDMFWGNGKSKVYLAQTSNTFVSLEYVKGKGYLKDGKPNIEDGKFNSYCLQFGEWKAVGNIFDDVSFLCDRPMKEN